MTYYIFEGYYISSLKSVTMWPEKMWPKIVTRIYIWVENDPTFVPMTLMLRSGDQQMTHKICDPNYVTKKCDQKINFSKIKNSTQIIIKLWKNVWPKKIGPKMWPKNVWPKNRPENVTKKCATQKLLAFGH